MYMPLFWKSHCAICSPVYVILYHVTGSCKEPIYLILSMLKFRPGQPGWSVHLGQFSRRLLRSRSQNSSEASKESWNCTFLRFLFSLNSQETWSLGFKGNNIPNIDRSLPWKPRSHVRIEQDLSWGQVQEAKSRCFDHRQNYLEIEGPEKPEGPEDSKVAPPRDQFSKIPKVSESNPNCI